MALELLELASWRATKRSTHPAVALSRPALENLEDRTVMASPASLGGGIGALLGQQAASFLPINITNVAPQLINGVTQLVASGTIAGQPFTAPLSFDTSPAATATSTPILHLHLEPINLNLLGLQVKTSEICLNIDANSGPGNLLGNLLGGLAHALDGGGTLGGFLGGLSSTDLGSLTSGLTSLLNGGLGALTNVANTTVLPSTTTNILHLSVGPVDLNVLGLQVTLDNCHNGPVTVDINAVSGSGNLLGNLLGRVAHLADAPNLNALDHALAQLGRTLDRLGL